MRAFFQKASAVDLRAADAVTADGSVLLDSGVVFFDAPTAVALARAHTAPPLRASTGLGVSAGDPALRTELYSDVILATQGGMGRGRAEYLADGGCAEGSALWAAREALWAALHGVAMHMVAPDGARFAHVGTTEELRCLLVRPPPLGLRLDGLLLLCVSVSPLGRMGVVGVPMFPSLCEANGCCGSYSPSAHPPSRPSGGPRRPAPLPQPHRPRSGPVREQPCPRHSSSGACCRATRGDAQMLPPDHYSPSSRLLGQLNSWVHGGAVVGAGSVVEHSVLGGDWHVGTTAWVSGVRARHAGAQDAAEARRVHDGCAVQEVALEQRLATAPTALHGKDPGFSTRAEHAMQHWVRWKR